MLEAPRAVLRLTFLALLAFATLARGQDPAAPPPGGQEPSGTVRVDTLQGLVGDIQDPERRQQLVDRLQALIEAAGTPSDEAAADSGDAGAIEGIVAFFRQLSDEAGQAIARVIDQVATIPARLRELGDALSDPERREALLTQAGMTLGIALLALGAYLLARIGLRRVHTALGRAADDRPLQTLARLGRATLRLLVLLVPAAAALAVAFAGVSVTGVGPAGAAVALAIATAVAFRAAANGAIDVVLAPDAPEVRLARVEDTPAQELARSLYRATSLAIYGYFLIVAIDALGADEDLAAALRSGYALLLLVVGVVLVLRYRRWPRSSEAQEEDTAERSKPPARERSGWRAVVHAVVGLWWLVALVYMLGLYALWISGIEGAFGTALEATAITLVCVVVGIAVYALCDAGLRKAGARLASLSRSLPAIRRRIPAYLTGARFVIGIAIAIVAAGFVFEAWGIRAWGVFQSSLVQGALAAVVGAVVVIFLAFATIDVSTALTEGFLHRKQRESKDSAKLRTLIPLAQKAIKLVVWVVAGLTVLGQLGVSIGPILASIGVLGLAVGFGAQTLVKDVITGVFILLEDAVSVGDIVMIDGTGGLVEAINIRTIRLRDLSGNVHTIPYSSVGQFANLTKEFSCYLIECGVAYREDVDEVIEILKELGAELQADPTFGPNILEPIEIFGLDRFEDSAVIVRARLKTKPMQQWSTGREFNRRMKRTFDERGIEIPFPHRTIYIGEDKQGSSPPLYVKGLETVAAGHGAETGQE